MGPITLTEKLWYNWYKITYKLKLWKLETGVDPVSGIPFVSSKWFWQESDPGTTGKFPENEFKI